MRQLPQPLSSPNEARTPQPEGLEQAMAEDDRTREPSRREILDAVKALDRKVDEMSEALAALAEDETELTAVIGPVVQSYEEKSQALAAIEQKIASGELVEASAIASEVSTIKSGLDEDIAKLKSIAPTPAPAPTITGISPTNGPMAGHNTVTITGTGLAETTAVPQVTFGEVLATNVVTDASGESLTCEAPSSAAGSVAVTVTTRAGSASTTYTYE